MSSVTAQHAADGERALRPATMLVILGMHRSGTSALARTCNLLGVDLGSDFIPTQPDNRSGFWEDAGVKDADDLALASHGLLWDDVRPLPEPWRDGVGGTEVRARLRATLAALMRRGPLCGAKDPRISRLLPLWLPLLTDLGATPAFLIALRDPAEVARSLARREAMGEARSLLLWLRYNLEAERHTRGHRRTFVCFDALLRDWRPELERIARELDVAWPVPAAAAADAIGAFLDPSLRHHEAATPAGDGLARLAHDAFLALRALQDEDTPARRAALDHIHATLAAGDEALGAVVAELEETLASRRAAAGDDDASEPAGGRSANERELDRARREAILAHELVGQRDRELADATARFLAERDALRERVAAGEAAVAATEAVVAARTADLAAARAETAVRAREVEILLADLAALDAKRAEALRVIADVEHSLSWRLTAPLRALSTRLRRR